MESGLTTPGTDYDPVRALRRILLEKGGSLHALCVMPSPDVTEIVARGGFDWIMLDMQHALVDRQTIANMIRALDAARVPALVRASWNRPDLVGWVLDAGAAGVLAPMVNSAQETRELVKACRYAPAGSRSWGALRTMAARPDYSTEVGNEVLVGAMIETAEGVENVDAILDEGRPDFIYVGQSDLAISFGLQPAEARTNDGHVARVRQIIDACVRRDRPIVISCDSPEEAKRLKAIGCGHLCVGTDFSLLRRAISAVIKSYRES